MKIMFQLGCKTYADTVIRGVCTPTPQVPACLLLSAIEQTSSETLKRRSRAANFCFKFLC